MGGINVLSVFDGMSCGQIALNRAGIKYNNYYASEIKKHAISVTKNNYPDTIHIGDVTKIDWSSLPKVDLLIGGSPCQDFSRGNKERLGLEGSKSSLFFKYVEAFEVLKPKYFLLENVVMDIEDNNFITKTLGVMPIRINSSLVSAQLRDRNYWTNIPGNGGLFGDMIDQPKDKNINFNNILHSGWSNLKKSTCLLESDSRPLSTPLKMFHRYMTTGMTTLIFKSEKHYIECKKHYESTNKGLPAEELTDNFVYHGVRYVNQLELEELQTVPDGYTSILNRNQASCLLGDGWTIDVICHILKGMS